MSLTWQLIPLEIKIPENLHNYALHEKVAGIITYDAQIVALHHLYLLSYGNRRVVSICSDNEEAGINFEF